MKLQRMDSVAKKSEGGEKSMKRVLFTVLIVFCAVVMSNGLANALVSGVCSNCHTMHNSQNGSPVAKDATGALTTTPQGHLTLSSCIGCHNGAAGIAGAPNIYGNTTTAMTAGGTFNTAVAATDVKRHVPTDVRSGGTTAAYATNGIPGYTGSFGLTVSNFNCAGVTGCHGNHDATLTTSDGGIRGFHHSKTTTAYRFLTLHDGSNTPVTGIGSSDFEATLIANGGASGDHNVYSSSSTGISKLCADCHGGFHGSAKTNTNVGNGSDAWIRHPVDLNISTALTGGISSIAADFINTPVGFASLTGRTTGESAASVTTQITSGNAQVVCVSCHRAHGTANDYILRFAYSGMVAGGGGSTGCLNCHVAQR